MGHLGKAVALGCAALATGGAAPAVQQATAADRADYFVVWRIAPEPVAERVRWVDPYTSFISAKLVPPRLLSAETDVLTTDGKVVISAGTHLAPVLSKAAVACTVRAPKLRGIESVTLFGADRYPCLVDADRDGRYESSFRHGTPVANLLLGQGRVPAKRTPVAPVSLVEVDAAAMEASPRIHVQYGWFASLANNLIFQTCIAESTKTPTDCFGSHLTVKRKALPGGFDALGGRFRVLAKEGDRVQVEILEPLRPQPLILYY